MTSLDPFLTQMDKACYDTFETYDTDSEYDGKNPNKAVEQVNI